MDENGTDNAPDVVQFTLGSPEYRLVAGGSVNIEVILTNPGPSDFFIVNLLGIPPGWIDYNGPSAVWVVSGGQERVLINICPPDTAEGIAGSYPGRVYVFSQKAPDQGKELPVLLTILPPEKMKKTFLLRVDNMEISAAPGTKVKLPLTLSNSSQAAEFLELSVQGVPANWISLPSPVITLLGGEEKVVDLFLQIPTTPEIRAGNFPLKISLASQKDPSIRDEIEVKLSIAAFESQGPVGVMMSSVQFAVAPGGGVTIPLTVLNRGLSPATFRLGIEGVPVSWISTSTPITPLQPGETKEISLMVRPPLAPSSQAGRRKFRLVVKSQEVPDQVVKVDCILTIAAFNQFSTGLDPVEAGAGKPVRVLVSNEGNTQQTFHLTLASQDNRLEFELLQPERIQPPAPGNGSAAVESQPPSPQSSQLQTGDPAVIQIPAGETAAFQFTARPRQRPLLGGMDVYSYQATVVSEQKESPALQGEVKGRGLIPVWVIAIFVILCLWTGFSAAFSVFGNRTQASAATQTSIASTALAAGPTQTMLAGTAISAGATQTIIANQTAAAIAGQQDTDGDGLTNQREAEAGTDPSNADTDADGLLDGEEVLQVRTNPLIPDTDGDGLTDGDEVQRRTNPLNADTDGDGSRDGDEVRVGSDPFRQDTDGDGLIDGAETTSCPHVLNPDSDSDGITDGRDLNPCDINNPALTATSAASRPTATTTMIPTVSSATQLPPVFTATLPPTVPSQNLPRFPGNVLFETNRDGNAEIYTANDSGQMKRLTNSPSSEWQGVWDPDMRRIAFTSNRDGQNEIYLMDADGNNWINLTNNAADDQNPTWSIDGQWIAFASNRDGNYEIYAVRVNNLETRNISNSPGNDTQPSWVRSRSGDAGGEYILFTSDRDGNQEIYRMRTDGTDAVNLTNNPASDNKAKGSPDGSQLLFTSDRNGNQEVYSMAMDGQGAVNLTNSPASDSGPVWSRDQVWIAFTTDRTGNREVFMMKPGLPDLYDLTNNPAQDQVSDWR